MNDLKSASKCLLFFLIYFAFLISDLNSQFLYPKGYKKRALVSARGNRTRLYVSFILVKNCKVMTLIK